jgi:DNA-binding XRE family transcriptional regulator
MPTNPLSSALKSKQKESKLSIAKLAKAIGANVQSVSGVLKGKTVPNKTTAPKYAKFLGLSVEELQAMSGPAKQPSGKRKPAKASKAKGGARKPAAKPKGGPKVAKPTEMTLSEATVMAADALAVAIHRATDAQRRIVAAVLRA